MPLNKLYLIIVVSIGSNLMYPPAKTNPVGLTENIKGKVDRVLAECGNIVMDFSKIRYCLNMKLEPIFIDSSTLE